MAEPLAGKGRLARRARRARYDAMHAHCDVLVVGARPLGPRGRGGRERPRRSSPSSSRASRSTACRVLAAHDASSRLYDGNYVARRRARPAALADPREADRARDRRDRAAAGLPRQRPCPGVMLAGAAAAYGNPEGVTPVSGGWSPRVHLWSQARGRLRWDDRIGAPVPDGELPRVECVGPRHRRGAARRAAVRAARRRRGRDVRRPRARLDRRRHPPRGRRRAALGRARQALHDDRHRLRPGQDRERERDPRRGGAARRPPRRARHDDVPAAVRAGLVRAARRPRPRRAVRPGARDADPPVARRARRGLRERRPVEAAALLPARRRGRWTRRCCASARAARERVGDDGRLDARQDRRPGPRRGRVPQPHLHERASTRSRSACAATA